MLHKIHVNTHLFHDNHIFRARLVSLGWTHCISGVACGFDTWVAEEILQRQKENKKITLECVIPFPGQADSWEKADQKRRYNILTAADKAVITSEQYNRGCFYPQSIHGRQRGCCGLCLQWEKRRDSVYCRLRSETEQDCHSD